MALEADVVLGVGWIQTCRAKVRLAGRGVRMDIVKLGGVANDRGAVRKSSLQWGRDLRPAEQTT